MSHDFTALAEYLHRVPGIRSVSKGRDSDPGWEIELELDLDDGLAWATVQELAYVLNMLSIEDRLPARFLPVSPPPYLNGGPREFLSWMIQSMRNDFSPKHCKDWLESRLPSPVQDRAEWPDPTD